MTTNLPIIKLLKDKAKDVRWWTVELIRNLANHGEEQSDYCHTANQGCKAEFHEVVATSIPLLLKPLEDKAKEIRCGTIKVIGELADHSEWQVESIPAQLTLTTKSSFAKPSHA
jgi:hypothetical protein